LNLNLSLEQKIKPMKLDAPNPSTLPPRDSHKRGLHRIMTLGGEYGTRNYTIKHLQSLKGKTVLTETMPFTTSEATAAEDGAGSGSSGL
jgi:3-methyl-2-oxobutanoate hydroxymethyltransferase